MLCEDIGVRYGGSGRLRVAYIELSVPSFAKLLSGSPFAKLLCGLPFAKFLYGLPFAKLLSGPPFATLLSGTPFATLLSSWLFPVWTLFTWICFNVSFVVDVSFIDFRLCRTHMTIIMPKKNMMIKPSTPPSIVVVKGLEPSMDGPKSK